MTIKKIKNSLIMFLFALVSIGKTDAQIAKTQVIQMTVEVDNNQIKLHINPRTFTGSYQLYRRSGPGQNWLTIANLASNATTYIDNTISMGKTAEYQIIQIEAGKTTAIGYAIAGNQLEPVPYKGGILLLIDSNFQTPLLSEIARLKQDLSYEGWNAYISYAGRNETVTTVKDRIKSIVNGSKYKITTMLILGHVPVPYSGNYSGNTNTPPPDGHVEGSGNHTGAWCTDAYYADLDGEWTDTEVSLTTGSLTRNHNLVGDGKFDQSKLPSALELEIGRIDLFNMPAFGVSDTVLTKNYLDRNHAFRTQQLVYPDRALIDNNFGGINLASTGYQNFASFFPLDSIFDDRDYITAQTDEGYLWSFGCGAGSYTTCSGIGSTNSFVNNDVKNIFTILSGSFFGDWDVQNNILKAPLGKNSLASFWGGIPKWYVHSMGLGKHIGYGTKITQNNSGEYFTGGFNYSDNQTTIALMGDPTLMNKHLPYVTQLNVSSANNNVNLNWHSVKGNIDGYAIFRVDTAKNDYYLIASVVDTFYIDQTNFYSGKYTYTVRPVRLENTASGSYSNVGGGIFKDVQHTNNIEKQLPSLVSVYPNPNKNGLVTVVANHIKSVALIDINGKEVNSTFTNNILDFSAAPNGTYLLRVFFENATESVIKLHKM